MTILKILTNYTFFLKYENNSNQLHFEYDKEQFEYLVLLKSTKSTEELVKIIFLEYSY